MKTICLMMMRVLMISGSLDLVYYSLNFMPLLKIQGNPDDDIFLKHLI